MRIPDSGSPDQPAAGMVTLIRTFVFQRRWRPTVRLPSAGADDSATDGSGPGAAGVGEPMWLRSLERLAYSNVADSAMDRISSMRSADVSGRYIASMITIAPSTSTIQNVSIWPGPWWTRVGRDAQSSRL